MKPHDCSRSPGFNGRACAACRFRIMGNADSILAGLMPPYNQSEGALWTSQADGLTYEFVAGAWHFVRSDDVTGDGVALKHCGCATAVCEHYPQYVLAEISDQDFEPAKSFGVTVEIEHYDRAAWDIPTNFSPRMGTLAR